MRRELYDRIVSYIVEKQNQFYRLAYSYVHNQEDALDVVQNAVCKALENYETLRNEEAVRTWFYRILVNESLMFLKKNRRETPTEDGFAAEIPYYEKGYEAEGDLYEEINRLESDVQNIVKLRFYEELPLKEIAEITRMNLNTVKAKLSRGLKRLGQNIQEVDL